MATYRGVESACQAVVELLRDNYDPAGFNQDLEFRVLNSAGFEAGLNAGVSLFLYRMTVGDTPRTPPGRRTDERGRLQTQLPLDLHFILTAWGPEVSLQQSVAGWMMRTMEDHPVLPPAFLNRLTDGVFRDDESIEIVLGELPTEDLLHLWELLGGGTYQLSVAYRARNIRIESERELVTAAPVQERITDFRGVDS